MTRIQDQFLIDMAGKIGNEWQSLLKLGSTARIKNFDMMMSAVK